MLVKGSPSCRHYSDVTWAACCLKSPAIRKFVQQRINSHQRQHQNSALLAFCEGKPPMTVTRGFPVKVTRHVESVPMSWRQHVVAFNSYYQNFSQFWLSRVSFVIVQGLKKVSFEATICMISYYLHNVLIAVSHVCYFEMIDKIVI